MPARQMLVEEKIQELLALHPQLVEMQRKLQVDMLIKNLHPCYY